jgi:hypothetical protein
MLIMHQQQAIQSALKSPQIRLLHIDTHIRAEKQVESSPEEYVLQSLHDGLAKHLKYFIFDDGPLYKVLRHPLRVIRERLPIGYIHDTFLFQEKVFGWVQRT